MEGRYTISDPHTSQSLDADEVIILVDIVRARRLAKKDPFGLSDPYVKLSLYNGTQQVAEFKTATLKKTLNPIWNSRVKVVVTPYNVSRSLLILEVFDANRITRDDFLGQLELSVKDIAIQEYDSTADKICPLQPRSTRSRVLGDLVLRVCRLPGHPSESDVDELRLGDGSDQSWDMLQDSEPLPPGWEEQTDDTGRTFYLDHSNQRTQWTRPEVAVTVSLPTGWEERIDANGRTFYVDHRSHRTQWERPTEESDDGSDAESMRQRARDLYLSRRLISDDDVEPRSRRSVAVAPSSPSSPELLATSPDSTSDDEPLPPGWSVGRTDNGKAFYIDHNTRQTTWDDPRKSRPLLAHSTNPGMTVASDKDLGPLPDGWEMRTHADGRTFFIDHIHKKTQWEDPRLAKLGGPAVKYNRSYQQKYTYFRSTLRKPTDVPNQVELKIRRKDLLETSYQAVMSKSDPKILKTRLWIEFDGEKGLDYGGLAREWFYLLSKEMFNPYYGLFETSAVDNYTLQINPLSGALQTDHLDYFKFIGRVAGMAVYHGKLLDGFFIRPFYKMMLDKEIVLSDMESVDIEYYNSLKWIVDNDPEDLELTFTTSEEEFGSVKDIELKPGGANVKVTNANKLEYVSLAVKWRFFGRIKHQMQAFNSGFNEIVARNLIKVFDENELEMVMCGIQDIDVNNWKAYTNYKGDYGPNHPTVVNFWKAVYLMSNESKARLLQFVTGTSRVPMNGFSELYGSNGPQRFTIECWGTIDKYPRAHTCFNRLDLPPYTSYSMLTERLTKAVENCEGFEGVD